MESDGSVGLAKSAVLKLSEMGERTKQLGSAMQDPNRQRKLILGDRLRRAPAGQHALHGDRSHHSRLSRRLGDKADGARSRQLFREQSEPGQSGHSDRGAVRLQSHPATHGQPVIRHLHRPRGVRHPADDRAAGHVRLHLHLRVRG